MAMDKETRLSEIIKFFRDSEVFVCFVRELPHVSTARRQYTNKLSYFKTQLKDLIKRTTNTELKKIVEDFLVNIEDEMKGILPRQEQLEAFMENFTNKIEEIEAKFKKTLNLK